VRFDHHHYHWEGTPEELAAASPTLRELMKREPKPPSSSPGGEAEGKVEAGGTRNVTEEEAVQILSRLSLSPYVEKVLGALYHSTVPISSEDLKKAVGLRGDEFRGVMGGFGRRVTHSVGKNVAFFVKVWREEQFFWGLPENVKRAMESLKII
jgi:hypothetical protein